MTLLPRSTPVLVLVAGALLLGSTGGAVAGSLITGAQIKDGTLRGVDVRNGSLGAADLKNSARLTFTAPSEVSGYEVVTEQVTVAGSTVGTAQATCPDGKVVTGAGSYWTLTYVAPQAYPNQGDPTHTFVAAGVNPVANPNTLVVQVYCVDAG